MTCLEFEAEDFAEISDFCKSIKIPWFASPWDEGSVDFIEQFNTPVYKIASASLNRTTNFGGTSARPASR